MNSGGQASIELILLLAVVLLLVATVIMPSFRIAEQAAADTSSVAIARSQAQKLVNAIELIDSSPVGAVQTIHLMIPAHSDVFCWGNMHAPGFDYTTDPNKVIIPSTASPEIEFSLNLDPLTKPGALELPESCEHDVGGTGDKLCTGRISMRLTSTLSCNNRNLMNRRALTTAAFFTAEISKDSTGITVVFNG